ncbi:hypothetical protein D3C76_136460 [compost metagenome]
MSTIPEFGQKLASYFAAVSAKLKAKPASVYGADNSLELGGDTAAELQATSATYLTAHAARKDNPHNVTIEQVGSYTNPEFDALLKQRVGAGIIPISRYGDLSFLPPGVSGSFEGSTTVKETGGSDVNLREFFSFQLEDNGTLTFLRNGTEGASYGVYYGFILGAANGMAGNKITLTTRRYKPAIVGAGNYVNHIYQGGTGIVAGRVIDALSQTLGKCFLALTNGSMNDVGHTACWLDVSWDAILLRSEIIVGKDKVYILYNQYATVGAPATPEPLEYTLYEIPKTAFDNVTTVTPTQVTIGQCTGFLGAQYNTGKLRFAAVAEAKDAVTPALIQHIGAPATWFSGSRHIGGSGRIVTSAAFNADFTKLRVMTFQDARYILPGSVNQGIKVCWSFVLDMQTLTATLDDGLVPMQIDVLNPTTLRFTGNVGGSNNGLAILGTTSADISARTYITNTGLIFASRVSYGPVSDDAIYRGKWNNFISPFDSLKAPMLTYLPETREALTCPRTYGSPAGDGFDGFRLIPGNQAVVYCRNASSSGALVKFKLKEPGEDMSTNYTYRSVTYPAGLIGYKPGLDRVDLNVASKRPDLVNTIYEMDDNGYVMRGSVLANASGYTSRYVTMAADMSVSGTVSATQAQLDALKEAIMTGAGYDPTTVVGPSIIEVVIPQNPAMLTYALVSFIAPNFDRRFVAAKVTLNARTGVLTSLAYDSIIINSNFGITANAQGSYFDPADGIRQGNHWIYEVVDGYMVTGNPMCRYQYPSGSHYARYAFFVNKSDGTTVSPRLTSGGSNIANTRYAALPGLGIGEVSLNDITTKLVFRRIAKTKAELAAWAFTDTAAQARVLISQEVAQGWSVYFTEPTPVIVNGVPAVLALASFDLAAIKADPSNSTFYVYVNMVNGVATYDIKTTYVAETATYMLIGTIVTGTQSITSMNIEKVTKFAGFRLSATPLGKSIPVTPGLPSRESHLDAGWF